MTHNGDTVLLKMRFGSLKKEVLSYLQNPNIVFLPGGFIYLFPLYQPLGSRTNHGNPGPLAHGLTTEKEKEKEKEMEKEKEKD